MRIVFIRWIFLLSNYTKIARKHCPKLFHRQYSHAVICCFKKENKLNEGSDSPTLVKSLFLNNSGGWSVQTSGQCCNKTIKNGVRNSN